jgi:hypothetical protein
VTERQGCLLRGQGECYPWLQGHHIIRRSVMKARLPIEQVPRAIADGRNIIPLCERHHHRVTHGWDRDKLAHHITARLPELRAFAVEYDLDAALDHELGLYGLA